MRIIIMLNHLHTRTFHRVTALQRWLTDWPQAITATVATCQNGRVSIFGLREYVRW